MMRFIMQFKTQVLVLALVLGGIFHFPRYVHAQEAAFFREATGTVEIQAPGSTVWVNAAAGDRISQNTVVSTGFKSSAVIVLGDSVVLVQPLTRLSLEDIIVNQNDEQVNLYLHTGKVRAEVKPPAGGRTAFVVRSPVVTASVRGTSFEFDTENLRVDEGRVVYSLANGRDVSVSAGSVSYVDETSNTVVSPFEAAAELLVPALPVGSGSGGPVGDRAPAVIPPVVLPPLEALVGIEYEWD
jgi:hypothetical protein